VFVRDGSHNVTFVGRGDLEVSGDGVGVLGQVSDLPVALLFTHAPDLGPFAEEGRDETEVIDGGVVDEALGERRGREIPELDKSLEGGEGR